MMTQLLLALLIAAPVLKTTTVLLQDGNRLNVEIATEPKDVNIGLMGHKPLAPDSGMLLDPHGTVRGKFYLYLYDWPVDILWIDMDKMIINLKENAVPCRVTSVDYLTKCQAYDSIWFYRYALQLPAGTVKRLKIHAGDIVFFDLPPDKPAAPAPRKR